MKRTILSAALIACASFNGVRAATNTALDCLQASAQSGALSVCLNESSKGGSAAISAVGMAPPGTTPALSVASLDAVETKRSTIVPTPTGYTSAQEGTLKAGFYNGLDSGFKTTFMGFVGLPILGIEASGAPYKTNVGTVAFTVLGVLLAIPGSIIGALVGAPLGAAAGMIAEKVSPGSTDGWFTF